MKLSDRAHAAPSLSSWPSLLTALPSIVYSTIDARYIALLAVVNDNRVLLPWGTDLGRRKTTTISVAEEVDVLVLADSTFDWLDPLACSCTGPDSLEEADGSSLGVASVVLSHDLFDCLSSLVGVVERDCADVVVEHVSLDNAVKKLTTNEAKLAIDCCSCATNEVPALAAVVWKSGVGVLEICNGDYDELVMIMQK